MLDFFRKLFTSDFMPHGHCYLWQTGILWLNVISDGFIAASYFSIPLALLYFVRKRRDIAFEWMFVMFGVFICACGTTHVLEIVTVWTPIYRFTGLIKAVTAVASVSTAVLLWKLMPRMIALPSPAQLRSSNQRLEVEATARTKVEAALLVSRNDLELRVKERTAELGEANAVLRVEIAERQRAREEAEQANEAKSEFLSRMSHELRTPMNAILGFAQLLESDAPTDPQTEAIAHILKGGRHLLALINEVLDIARVESGQMSLSPEPINATAVLIDTLDLVRPLANERKLTLRTDFDPEVDCWVTADRQRLKQILVNLLSNAVKFNREGGRITVTCKAPSENLLRLCVEDTGPGISPADHERIFSAFDRLEADRTGVQGTGLGLTLAKRLTELMGGSLRVESELGKGSVFCVEFPRTQAHASSLLPVNVHVAELPLSDPGYQSTLLYIEDNLPNLALVTRILTKRPGVRLISALRGDLGLASAREKNPDMILLDLDLPGLHGSEVLRQLRADPLLQHTPVVIISANALPRSVEQLLLAGANAYLTKPININELLQVLDKYLKVSPARVETAAAILNVT